VNFFGATSLQVETEMVRLAAVWNVAGADTVGEPAVGCGEGL